MSSAKIEFTLGNITFSGEGEETWVSNQLDKILEKAPDLIKIVLETQATTQATTTDSREPSQLPDDTISSQPLPQFLRTKGASTPAAKKFLATAIWLHAKGSNRLATGDITKALRDSNQSRLPNPSQSLSKNVSKGLIEKDGNQFFVTDTGRASL